MFSEGCSRKPGCIDFLEVSEATQKVSIYISLLIYGTSQREIFFNSKEKEKKIPFSFLFLMTKFYKL